MTTHCTLKQYKLGVRYYFILVTISLESLFMCIRLDYLWSSEDDWYSTEKVVVCICFESIDGVENRVRFALYLFNSWFRNTG